MTETVKPAQMPSGRHALPPQYHSCFCDPALSFAPNASTPPRRTPGVRTHPLGGWDPEAVLLHVEAAGRPHLPDEIQVAAVLCLRALPPAVPPSEVKEAAGKDKEAAAVGRPLKIPMSAEARVRKQVPLQKTQQPAMQ